MTAAYATEVSPLKLKARTAAELMTERVVSIPEAAPLREAIAMLVDRGFSGAPVVNDVGRPVGVISLSDIVVHDRNSVAHSRPVPEYYSRTDLEAEAGESLSGFQVEAVDRTRVGDVMTPVVCAVRPDTPARH